MALAIIVFEIYIDAHTDDVRTNRQIDGRTWTYIDTAVVVD